MELLLSTIQDAVNPKIVTVTAQETGETHSLKVADILSFDSLNGVTEIILPGKKLSVRETVHALVHMLKKRGVYFIT